MLPIPIIDRHFARGGENARTTLCLPVNFCDSCVVLEGYIVIKGATSPSSVSSVVASLLWDLRPMSTRPGQFALLIWRSFSPRSLL